MEMSARKGWEGALRVATTEAGLVGASDESEVQRISPTHGPNLEALYEIGSRSPTEIKEGNIEIGLDIEVRYVVGSVWPGYCGVGSTGAHTTYFVGIYPQGYGAGKPKIVLQGKFGDWGLEMPQDGVLLETLSFLGTAISVGTI